MPKPLHPRVASAARVHSMAINSGSSDEVLAEARQALSDAVTETRSTVCPTCRNGLVWSARGRLVGRVCTACFQAFFPAPKASA